MERGMQKIGKERKEETNKWARGRKIFDKN